MTVSPPPRVVFVGDEHHRYFQEKQSLVLTERRPDTEVIYWSTVGLETMTQLDVLGQHQPLILIASRHGAIPVLHWVARNPGKTRKLVLLHPSLHLNFPGLEAPDPHFISTTIICHSKASSPGYEEIAEMAGKFFHDYSLHLTSEPAELKSTLTLLTLD